jgi:hypothetical protein
MAPAGLYGCVDTHHTAGFKYVKNEPILIRPVLKTFGRVSRATIGSPSGIFQERDLYAI